MMLDLGAGTASTTIGERIAALRDRVALVSRGAGRASDAVTILAVTKTQPRESVEAAIAAGMHDVGENYVQEARDKYAAITGARKHYIGHVQTNKAKLIVSLFDVVQSVDRLEAGLALAKAARAAGKTLHALVQVNVSPYDRFGIAPESAPGFAESLRNEGLVVDGVMAIGPLDADAAATEQAFAIARRAHEAVGGNVLSLGMSGDWERAIAHGSTMIRIGTAIFGARAPKGEVA